MSKTYRVQQKVTRDIYHFDGCPGMYGIDKAEDTRWYAGRAPLGIG